MIQQSRRGFLLGLLAAPVIVKATSLMPIKPVVEYGWTEVSLGFAINKIDLSGRPTKLIVPPYIQQYMAELMNKAEIVACNQASLDHVLFKDT
jgi:hypothetical protein